jgi:hypothetical protein
MPRSYVSDFTRFINDFKSKNPQVEEGQVRGRAILWDKSIDRDAQRRYRESRVPQQAYVYQNEVAPVPAESDR